MLSTLSKGGQSVRKLYTAQQLAEILQVKPHTVYLWGNKGVIKSIKIGGQVRFYNPAEDKEA